MKRIPVEYAILGLAVVATLVIVVPSRAETPAEAAQAATPSPHPTLRPAASPA
jgi:hypothetical protein